MGESSGFGGFLAVARDEGHGGALVEQPDDGHHAFQGNGELLGNVNEYGGGKRLEFSHGPWKTPS